jgi:hypothetical protein
MDSYYSRSEDIDLSFSSYNSNIFTFKTEVKNLTFNLSVVKFIKISDTLEKIIERNVFSLKDLDSRPILTTSVGQECSDLERVELHLTLYDQHLDSRYFYFDLGKMWTGGGKFFIRDLRE